MDGDKRSAFYERFRAALEAFDPEQNKDAPVPPWDDYFHAIAQTVALRSKDGRRKVGAVIVSEDKVVLATGYNWLPRGIRETPERTGAYEKARKLRWVTHAETN